MTNRREFVIQISVAGSAMLAGQAMAQAPMVVETDAAAAGLGYKADTTKVDAKKYPKHAATQLCNNCALYQGRQLTQQVVAHCLPASRSLARAGAVPGPKRPDFAASVMG